MSGCEGESQDTPDENGENGALCVSSGGVWDGSRCKCREIICDEGILCDTVTKQCANKSDGEKDSACVLSGGVLDGSRCKCGEVICDEGVLCNTVTKQCGNKVEGGCLYNESDSSKNTICNSGRMMTCTSSNLWEAGDICEYGCRADGKDCSDCSANTFDGDSFIECKGGAKQTAVPCEHGCSETGCYGFWENCIPKLNAVDLLLQMRGDLTE